VRWFEYGVWCPLFRLHGDREPRIPLSQAMSGGPNEVWSYGDEVYEILSGVPAPPRADQAICARADGRGSQRGYPAMRPLWFDFPGDKEAWAIDDEYCFGPSVLVAPVTKLGARSRRVYLPAGATWTDPWSGETLKGGTWVEAAAPLERIPFTFATAHRCPPMTLVPS